jgi:tetratricopeptide (TPR) repeat protein
VQDEIVSKVVTTPDLLLKLDERQLPNGLGAGRPTDNVEAFDDLLRAFESPRTTASMGWESNPEGSEICAGLRAARNVLLVGALYHWSENPAADLKHPTELAQQALSLDDSNGMALEQLCEIDWMQRRFDESVAEGQRTVALNSSYAIGYQALKDALLTFGRPEAAICTIEKAIRLDPAGEAFYAYFIGAAYVQNGRYQEAIPFLKGRSQYIYMSHGHTLIWGCHIPSLAGIKMRAQKEPNSRESARYSSSYRQKRCE